MRHIATTVQVHDSVGDTPMRGRNPSGDHTGTFATDRMTLRSARTPRTTAFAALTALALVMVGLPMRAEAQRVGGSIGVSLTILEPVTTRAVEVTGFRVDRDGMATVETTAPTSGQASQVVMTRVASSADGFVPVRLAPVLLRGAGSGAAESSVGGHRMHYLVNVGRVARDAGAQRDVELRIEYLAVAGT